MFKKKKIEEIADCNFFGYGREQGKEELKIEEEFVFKKKEVQELNVEIRSANDWTKGRRYIVIAFYIALLTSCFCIGNIFTYAIKGNHMVGYLMGYFGILMAFSALCYKYSLVAYQMKIARLCPVTEWFKNKKEWFPH